MPVGDTTPVPVTPAWSALSAAIPALTDGDDIVLQHAGPASVRILFGEFAAAPPASAGGLVLIPFQRWRWRFAAARPVYIRADHAGATLMVSDDAGG